MTRLRTVFNDANTAWNNRIRAAQARKLTRAGAESVELLRLYAKRLDNAAREAAGQVLRTRSRAVSTEDRERPLKRVFLSFRTEDRAKVNGLRLLVTNPDFDVEFDEEPARVPYDSDAAAAVRRRIGEKIARADVTVCLVSAETHTCPWVTWELEQSIGKGNAIVCMGFRDGPRELVLPEPVRRLNIGWWGWNYSWPST